MNKTLFCPANEESEALHQRLGYLIEVRGGEPLVGPHHEEAERVLRRVEDESHQLGRREISLQPVPRIQEQ